LTPPIRRALAALLAWALACCAPAPAFADAAHARVRFAQVNEPTSLNPVLLSGYDEASIAELLFEPLLRLGADSRWVPGLAVEEPTLRNGGISADGKTITVRLRPRTLWSDGAPVTADDVKFAVDQVLNPKNVIGSRAGFDQIAGMRVPNPQTIEFLLKRPNPSALAAIDQVAPLPKHLLGALADLNKIPYNGAPVGNGPYVLTEWKRGDYLRLSANPRYWRGAPKIASFELRFVPSVKTALLQLQTHEVDMIAVPPAYVEQVPVSGIARASAASLGWSQLTYNVANPLLADPAIRRAIALGIDRDALARVSGHGLFKTDRVMLPLFQWALDPAVEPPAYDPKAASALLDRAGWLVGADGLRHKGDATLSLTMVFGAGGTGIGPATVAQDLANLHIKIDQKPVGYELLYDTPAAGGTLATGKFDLAYIGLQTNPDPDVSWLFACNQRRPAGFNFADYCSAGLDAALETAGGTFERSARLRALAAVQRRLIDDNVFLPLFRIDDLYAFADWLHGIDPSPYTPFWNIYDWSAT
jgi:peptide/nickel transport system substrate-binding protein